MINVKRITKEDIETILKSVGVIAIAVLTLSQYIVKMKEEKVDPPVN